MLMSGIIAGAVINVPIIVSDIGELAVLRKNRNIHVTAVNSFPSAATSVSKSQPDVQKSPPHQIDTVVTSTAAAEAAFHADLLEQTRARQTSGYKAEALF